MNPKLLVFFFLSYCTWSTAQSTATVPRQTQAFRTQAAIKIDGSFDEPDWQNALVATDFMQTEPNPGIESSQNTEVRVLYDDKALYIAATLYDESPDSILQQLSERDNGGITDWFALVIDSYQDGQNGSGFIVTASGVQIDTKYSAVDGNEEVFDGDTNWDAVWDSSTKYTGEGWTVEMRIPYSALRFPKVDNQIWNINFARMIRRKREVSYWNEVKPSLNGILNQSGKLNGIKDIKSPVRLSATPFIVSYFENFTDPDADPKSNWLRSISGGMDIKYGINDAFTLDMTLIPDFGQTQSDNQVLNLSPFEVRFNENRQFFTEGTELFNKGNLFYSRRVGGRPLGFFDVYGQYDENTEEITSNPQESQLFNATKISGRTNNGLGLGFFNATSNQSFATIKNIETGEKREIETSPVTNYNVMVLDQNLKNNSYFSLINTNVWRDGTAYDANVTGTEFFLRNKANSYGIVGDAALTQKYYSGAETASGQDSVGLGYKYNIGLEKTSGNFQFGTGYGVESRYYDPNDLGFLFSPNSQEFFLSLRYNIFKPFSIFNRARFNSFISYSRLQDPNVFTDFAMNFRGFFVTKSFFAFGFWSRFEPIETYDYFDPRSEDFSAYYAFPTNAVLGLWVSSDYRKKFAYDVNVSFRNFNQSGRQNAELSFEPRFRVNDKLFFKLEVESVILKNDVGFVFPDETGIGYNQLTDSEITYSQRDQLIFDNVLSANYIFNNKMSLTLRTRHYWTRLKYDAFHRLGEDGSLYETVYKGKDDLGTALHDTSFNIFNIDMVYRWRFAPGSDLFFVWKNSISDSSSDIGQHYFNNLGSLVNAPQLNSFSLKIIYFLDYLSLKKS